MRARSSRRGSFQNGNTQKEEEAVKRILICIAGGGAIQLEAAAGALAALDESGALNNADVSYRACSGGAPVAALHAAGMRGSEIATLLRKTPMKQLLRWPLLSRYCDAAGVFDLLDDHLPEEPMRHCRVAVTRVRDMRSMMVDATPVTVLTSMSIPGAFRPQKISGEEFVDGGVMNLIPTPPIPEINNYSRIYLLLPPWSDEEAAPGAWWRLLETELKSLVGIMDREITQVYENQWDKLPNTFVLHPDLPQAAKGRSLFAELLDWSPNYCMVEHARQFALTRIQGGLKL